MILVGLNFNLFFFPFFKSPAAQLFISASRCVSAKMATFWRSNCQRICHGEVDPLLLDGTNHPSMLLNFLVFAVREEIQCSIRMKVKLPHSNIFLMSHNLHGSCLCRPTNPRTHIAACLQILHNLLLFFDFFRDLCVASSQVSPSTFRRKV